MPSSYLRLLCAAVLAAQSCAWSFTPSSELGGIGDEGALVAFILPEIESCKKLEEQWSTVQETQPALAVDCAAEPDYCLSQDVHSHPAIRAYIPGAFKRYRGPRKADDILSFFKRIRQDTPTPIPPTFPTSDAITILAVLPSDEPLRKRYADVAERYADRYTFGLQATDGPPGLRCRNNPDGLEFELADLSRMSDMEDFVRKCGAPLVREMSRRSETSIMQTGKSVVHYLPTSSPDRDSYISTIRPLAKRFAEFLVFVTVDGDEYPDMAASLGHAPGARGVLSVQNSHTGDVYPMGGAVTAEAVEGFILGISRGEVPAWDGRARRGGEVGHDEL